MNFSPPDRELNGAGFLLRLIAMLGLLAGLGEVLLFAGQKFILHRFIFVGRDVVWMAPLAELILFLTLGGLFFLARRLFRGLTWVSVLLFFATLAMVAMLWMISPLHKGAAILLAIGVGVTAARASRRRPHAVQGVVRLGFPVALATAILLGVGFRGFRWWQERRAVAALPSAANHAPNVLLIILDTVRAWNLSGYGYARPTTPNLDQLMHGGVRFDWAFSQAPWTLPSHASLFTGRLPHELGANWLTAMDASYPTLADVLGQHGYLTAGFVANQLYLDYEKGTHQGFQHYEDYPFTLSELFRNSAIVRELSGKRWIRNPFHSYQLMGRKDADAVNGEFLSWLDGAGGRPFFAFLNYFDAHAPYLPADSTEHRFATPGLHPDYDGWIRYRGRPKGDSLPRDYVLDNRDRYDAMLAQIDAALGRLFAELTRRGILDQTIVIVASDHGEQFGEHNLMGHGNSLYLPALHVPLIIRFPDGAPGGREVSRPVALRDVAATVLDLARIPGPASLPGRSLARFWRDSAPAGPDTLLMEVDYNPRLPKGTPLDRGSMRAVVLDSLHYILNGDKREELYDFLRDSVEMHDLSGSAADLGRQREALRALAPPREGRP
ncbi:MAG: sulfatase-like hydrolase/transferase [Gemmatimonadota bacterium]